jgi:hypothetical protein
MKYYHATIEEHHGEFECSQSILIATEKDAHQRHEEITKDWYGIDLNEDPHEEGVYWNDCMTYQSGTLARITKRCFEELKKKTYMGAFFDEDTDTHQMEEKYDQS